MRNRCDQDRRRGEATRPVRSVAAVSDQLHHDIFDRGLTFDLATVVDRRRVLALGAGVLTTIAIAACGDDDGADTSTGADPVATSDSASGTTGTTGGTVDEMSCMVIPEETAGPYPGDGSNGVDVLTESGGVRGDIRSSFGSSTSAAEGVPLIVSLSVVDSADGCAPLAGAAVYLWHCDREGRYSMYSAGVENENYLRGVQETAADGTVSFTSIYPGCYPGRWPHIHFEVYESVDDITSATNAIATSQLAFPEDVCAVVYTEEGYEGSVGNLNQISLDRDNVFSDDGAAQQLATLTGAAADGYTATLTIVV